jgi:hypothetical protein
MTDTTWLDDLLFDLRIEAGKDVQDERKLREDDYEQAQAKATILTKLKEARLEGKIEALKHLQEELNKEATQ